MKLSQYFEDVRRDGSFALTGPYDGGQTGILCFAGEDRYLQQALRNEKVVAVLVPEVLAEAALAGSVGVAVVSEPREAFFLAHNRIVAELHERLGPATVEVGAKVASTAIISPGATVAAGATIEDLAFIGPKCLVSPGAYVGHGAIIGVPGHFEQWARSRRLRVEHGGWVHVAAGAQVLAGAVVQRDVFAVEIEIGEDAVVGPGVLLAHGVAVGPKSVVAGGVTVAGYTTIGASVWIGPGSTIGNKLEIGDGARIEIGSTVVQSVPAGERVSGNFAVSHTRNLRAWKKMSA